MPIYFTFGLRTTNIVEKLHGVRGATLFFAPRFRTPSTFYPSDLNYFIILGISSDGINAIVTHKGGHAPQLIGE